MIALDSLYGIMAVLLVFSLSFSNVLILITIVMVGLSVVSSFETPVVQSSIPLIQGKDSLIQSNAIVSQINMLANLDTVDNSQINVLSQRTMHRICTAATNEEVSFAYRVAIPRQRFRWRNAFSTRWRSL